MTDQASDSLDLTDATPDGGSAWTSGSGLDGLDERVEFSRGTDAVLVRDPRYPEGPQLRFSPEQWTALLTAPLPAREIDLREEAPRLSS